MFDKSFYPTPNAIARLMMSKISSSAENILEPSAGTGELAEVAKNYGKDQYYGRSERGRKVDCIESDPERAMVLHGKEFPIVGMEWLTYTGVCYYDAIVMNPPFADGAAHLLKAWEFLHDGEIVCLLNEETLKNPYTAERQRLAAIVEANGTAEYLDACFATAERKTATKVALVYLKKVAESDSVDVWSKSAEEKKADEDVDDPAANMLAVPDKLGNMQHYYDAANEHMLKGFQHIRKAFSYMSTNGIAEGYKDNSYKDICAIALGNLPSARSEFLRKHRKDSWNMVFASMNFHKFLDKKQREQLLRDLERDAQIPFTAGNIKGTLENIVLQRKQLFEQSVCNVFDELVKHFKGNATSEGWKTNDGHKVNRKLIFPYGCQFDEFTGFQLRWGCGAIDIYNDLDRVMSILAGAKFEEIVTIGNALEARFKVIGGKYVSHKSMETMYSTSNNTVDSTYFKVKFWKKGTVHLEFKDAELWQKFNITAAKGRMWLGENTNDRSDFPGRKAEYAHA